jgi:hypothetical protein
LSPIKPQSRPLVPLLQSVELLKHRRLGVDLLKLGILELLSASQTHLKVLDGANLLLETADLLGVRVLCGIRSSTSGTLALMSMVSMAVAVSVTAASGLVVTRLAPVAVIASLGAATLVAGAVASVMRRRRQASSAVRLALGPALTLGILLISLLLVLRLGRVFIAQGFSSGNGPNRGSLLSQVSTGHSAARATETVGTDVG